MKRTALALTLIWALLVSTVAEILFANLTFAQTFETITIKADGSIDPPTASITQSGNVYTLIGNIFGTIEVERFNIVIDGAGYTIQGNKMSRGIEITNPYNATIKNSYNVTIKNAAVKGFHEGIAVFGYWGNILSGIIIAQNNVTDNNVGIRFSSYFTYSNNTIIGNNITANNIGVNIEMAQEGGKEGSNANGNIITRNQIANNKVGMKFVWLYSGGYETNQMNNTVFYNNFISNSQNVFNDLMIFSPESINIWDNSTLHVGNYWSDYNGTDNNHDGIGDTPYVIDENNIDRCPLMKPVKAAYPSFSQEPTTSPLSESQTSEPFPTTLITTASIVSVAVISIGLLVYFKKRNHAKISKHGEMEQSST